MNNKHLSQLLDEPYLDEELFRETLTQYKTTSLNMADEKASYERLNSWGRLEDQQSNYLAYILIRLFHKEDNVYIPDEALFLDTLQEHLPDIEKYVFSVVKESLFDINEKFESISSMTSSQHLDYIINNLDRDIFTDEVINKILNYRKDRNVLSLFYFFLSKPKIEKSTWINQFTFRSK